MTKAELTSAIKEVIAGELEVKVTNAKAVEITEGIFSKIVEALVADGEVVLPGIGKIKLAKSAARKGVTQGKAWEKPETTTAKLRLGKELKEKLNS